MPIFVCCIVIMLHIIYYLSNCIEKQINCLMLEDVNRLKHNGNYIYKF
jgi:hypothetical protein